MNNISAQTTHVSEDADPHAVIASPDAVRIDAITRIAAAFASRQDATVDQVLSLTSGLAEVFPGISHAPQTNVAMSSASSLTSADPIQPTIPALDPKKAVTADKVFCLCCGRGFTMLKRHLKAEHGLSEDAYRKRFNLPQDYPLVAPEYSDRKARYAKEIGLGKHERDKNVHNLRSGA